MDVGGGPAAVVGGGGSGGAPVAVPAAGSAHFLPFCDAFLKGVSILKYKGRTLLLKNCSFYKKTHFE